MPETFYHVDRWDNREVGDRLELEWPGRLHDGLDARSSPENEAQLQRMYPDGLSTHGARYAHAALVRDEDRPSDEDYERVAGKVYFFEHGNLKDTTFSSFSLRDETILELVRQASFEDCRSRFQSFFAFENLSEAKSFRREYRSHRPQILEVTCDAYAKRDMDLVSGMYFAEGVGNAERYWRGEAGSDTPTWEIVMEPPVEITGRAVDSGSD